MAFKINVIRPDDLLNLQIECRNLQLDTNGPDGPVLIAEDSAQVAYLIIYFPPQTIAEEAVFEPEPFPSLEDDAKRQETEEPQEKERREKVDKSLPSMETILKGGTARARLGEPSRLVFQLPANSNPRIPYTIEGLLNWSELSLSVSPIADIPETPTPEQWQNAPSITPPSDVETAIEMPYRLILSPNKSGIWTHATKLKTHAGRTELWHTRLAYRDAAGKVLDISKARPATLRAIWSPDYVSNPSKPGLGWPVLGAPDQWAGKAVLTAMNARDRHELVILTSAFRTFIKSKADYSTYVPKPIYAEQVILTGLGGWLKSRGNWDPPVEWLRTYNFAQEAVDQVPQQIPNEPIRRNPADAGPIERERLPRLENLFVLLDPAVPERRPINLGLRLGEPGQSLNISEWVHTATQGRDHYVRIVYEGFLYPFCHPAALIKITERKFRTVNGFPYAYLSQHMFIVVRKPLKDYTQEGMPDKGRGMPLKKIRMTTLITPDIDPPIPIPGTQYAFWVKVQGNSYRFSAVAKDRDIGGHAVDLSGTMIFVPNSDTSQPALGKVRENYNSQPDSVKGFQVPGQAVTFADPNGDISDNTTLTTRLLFFDTNEKPADSGPFPFQPKLLKAGVNLAAVEQLLGTTTPVDIQYYKSYVSGNFDSGNEVFAELISPVKSEFTADKAGGIATPNLSVTGVARKLGAVAGDLGKAVSNQFEPANFFKDFEESATLFGKLKLTELIVSGDFSKAPTIQFLPQAVPPAVRLTWKPEIQNPPPLFFQFMKTEGSVLNIEGVIEQPVDGKAGRSKFTGSLTKFSLVFLKVIRLTFDSFDFTAETGKKTDVNVHLRPGDDAIEFLGDLKFVNELKEIIPPGLFGDGPSLEITPQPAIRAGFAIGLPPVAIGVFALKDVSLGAALTLPFMNGSPLFDFNVSEREHPFNLTIAFFGGGGFFRLQLDTLAVRIVEAAFEFGASASINLGVASGGVYIMAGIYFKLETQTDGSKAATLTGYFRMGGELSVLGIISISLEFYLSFTYEKGKVVAGQEQPGKAIGIARLTVKVEVLMFSKSIVITVEKKFGGQDGDPVFAEVWDAPSIWSDYSKAFA
jgi:hypothetical protein